MKLVVTDFLSLIYCHVLVVAWRMIVGSKFDDWVYWTPLWQLQSIITAHTLNSSLKTSVWRISHISLTALWISDSGTTQSCESSRVLCYDRRSVGQSVWEIHPSGAYDQIFITVKQLRVCWCGAHSLTRGRVCRLQLQLDPRQYNHSRVRVPWDSRPYFTLSDSRLPFSSTPTCRATVEVFDLASKCPFMTRCGPRTEYTIERFVGCNLPIPCHENLYQSPVNTSNYISVFLAAETCLADRCLASVYSALPRECADRSAVQQMDIFRISDLRSHQHPITLLTLRRKFFLLIVSSNGITLTRSCRTANMWN
jgi:hypothetical protein